MTGQRAHARRLPDGRWGIWCRFEDRFEAKAVPGARWDKNLRCWTVPPLFAAEAQRLVDQLNGPPSDAADGVSAAQAWRTIFAGLDAEVARALFRRASLALHPDTGGDAAAFRALDEGHRLAVAA